MSERVLSADNLLVPCFLVYHAINSGSPRSIRCTIVCCVSSVLVVDSSAFRSDLCWGQRRSDQVCAVDVESVVDLLEIAILSLLVPELVEQLVVVLFPVICLDNGIEILFWDDSCYFFIFWSDLNVYELLSGLKCSIELEVEAPAHQYD